MWISSYYQNAAKENIKEYTVGKEILIKQC